MYKTDNFNIVLNMGERSIISDLIIQDGSKQYVLNAEECFKYAFSNRDASPWRDDFGKGGELPDAEDWLPKKWTWSPLDGKDVMWEITGLESKVDITVRCTRTPAMVAKKVKYGEARLNVDIVEPYDYNDQDTRPNASGFCKAGAIAKLGSTANTDWITEHNACTQTSDDLEIAQILCGDAVTKPGVPGCQRQWCGDHIPQLFLSSDSTAACVGDIEAHGWHKEFCALTVFGARTCNGDPLCLRTAKDCKDDAQCRECLNTIKDDGLPSAVLKYDISGLDPSGDCGAREDMPADLLGVCQKGVRVQYFDSVREEWVTKFAIPSTMCVQDGFLSITKQTDPELFYNPMRLVQCAAPDGACLTGKCDQEIGFKASIEVTVAENQIEKVWNLWESEDLVCNPQRWNTPTECLGFTPEPTCPCPE
jgi:hypothetical protein